MILDKDFFFGSSDMLKSTAYMRKGFYQNNVDWRPAMIQIRSKSISNLVKDVLRETF